MRSLACSKSIEAEGCGRCTGIYAPICLKKAVDALGGVVNQAAVNRTVQALLVAGACRIANSLAKEAQGPMFTPIAQVCPHPSVTLTNQPSHGSLSVHLPESDRAPMVLGRV